jgi:hypothetical protein
MKYAVDVAMALFISVSLVGCGNKEQLKQLTSTEIQILISGNTVEGMAHKQNKVFRQYFGKNGDTVQVLDVKRTGKWRVDDNNQYCVLWTSVQRGEKAKADKKNADSRRQKERCFAVNQDSQGAYRVINNNQNSILTIQKIVPGNPEKL